MKKKCQIRAVYPITCFEVPIVGTTELNLTPDEIYKCLCAKAEIDEVLSNGTLVHIDFTNYDKDNEIKKENVEVPVKETVINFTDVVEIKEEINKTVVEETVEDSSEEVEENTEEESKEEVIEDLPKTHEVVSRNNNKNYKKLKNNKR